MLMILIEPEGIETISINGIYLAVSILIEPEGIETSIAQKQFYQLALF